MIKCNIQGHIVFNLSKHSKVNKTVGFEILIKL